MLPTKSKLRFNKGTEKTGNRMLGTGRAWLNLIKQYFALVG